MAEPTGFCFVDGTVLQNTVVLAGVSSDVATIDTNVDHGYIVGQWVFLAFDPADSHYLEFSQLNGLYQIINITATDEFQFATSGISDFSWGTETPALNTVDLDGWNALGNASSKHFGLTSPIATGTSEVRLVFPPGAKGCTIQITDNDGFVGRRTTQESFPVPHDTAFYIPGKDGDELFIARTSSGGIVYFEFDLAA